MTKIGSVIEGKYEILKEIGRGGMSTVYLAMDRRLNKQWAVKEIRKKGSGKNDEIVVNSLLAEANLMKRLDHPSLPRIVDIIDNGVTIYVVMDYIEGESLDKILEEYGAQPEELVIGWAKQLCDALSYLHSQKPPIIYRDMKPANIMLKPEGNIKIIDFGIAREYKEQSLADTTVLGTKGYAPPEQYSGQTDPRSDIFALGMTMHHLLTGIDPRNGEPYAPVRQWNPELSEGIEAIINRCVEPAAENRYQSCTDLLYDLEHPELITQGFRKKQKRKLSAFLVTFGLAAVLAIAGFVMSLTATRLNEQDYGAYISSSNPKSYYSAIEIYPERVEAYQKLLDYSRKNDVTDDEITKIGNMIERNADVLDLSDPEVAELYYDMGKMYFAFYNADGSLKSRAVAAQPFFETAVRAEASFGKKKIAGCYAEICKFVTEASKISDRSLNEFTQLFQTIEDAMAIVDKASDSEANYDKISFYYAAMMVINDQAQYMANVGFERSRALGLMAELKQKTEAITPGSSYIRDLVDKAKADYEAYIINIDAKYTEVEKQQQGRK